MKKAVLFPFLLVICSVISAVITRCPFAYFNVFLSIVVLCLMFFFREKSGLQRIIFSALWLFILELLALLLFLFGVNIYQPPFIWLMYAVFLIMDVCITPRINKEK